MRISKIIKLLHCLKDEGKLDWVEVSALIDATDFALNNKDDFIEQMGVMNWKTIEDLTRMEKEGE